VLVAVAHAGNEVEAGIIVERLRDAGIAAMTKGPDVPQMGRAGPCSVYVDEHLEARARGVLATPAFSDEELAELSDQAAREQG
jgi:hypothetical protein